MTTTTRKAKNRLPANGHDNGGSSEPDEHERRGGEALNAHLTITAPNMKLAKFKIRGDAPFVQNKFSKKAYEAMRKAQELGQVAKKDKKREPKDFAAAYEDAIHYGNGCDWGGIPANGMRAALVSACRAAGYAMTKAKLALFVVADGFDETDGTPLIQFTKGKPQPCEHLVRIQQTTDIRVRALWAAGWEATVTVKYDADMFSLQDVANLVMRVGIQVGVGEGRPDSRSSSGMGWGTFELCD